MLCVSMWQGLCGNLWMDGWQQPPQTAHRQHTPDNLTFCWTEALEHTPTSRCSEACTDELQGYVTIGEA